jgi:hypothetical protein
MRELADDKVGVPPSFRFGSADPEKPTERRGLMCESDGTVDWSYSISNSSLNPFAELDAGSHFGVSVGTIGDLDGDGVVDIVVGAHIFPRFSVSNPAFNSFLPSLRRCLQRRRRWLWFWSFILNLSHHQRLDERRAEDFKQLRRTKRFLHNQF